MIPTLKTTIYEDCNSDPYVKTITPRMRHTYSKWLVPYPLYKKTNYFAIIGKSTYELHVPENTIINKDRYRIK